MHNIEVYQVCMYGQVQCEKSAPQALTYYAICFVFFARFYFPASGQAVVTGVVPSFPRFLPSIFIAYRVQQYHCSSIFHRVLLTDALALSASQFVLKKKFLYEYALGGARTRETGLCQGSRIT